MTSESNNFLAYFQMPDFVDVPVIDRDIFSMGKFGGSNPSIASSVAMNDFDQNQFLGAYGDNKSSEPAGPTNSDILAVIQSMRQENSYRTSALAERIELLAAQGIFNNPKFMTLEAFKRRFKVWGRQLIDDTIIVARWLYWIDSTNMVFPEDPLSPNETSIV